MTNGEKIKEIFPNMNFGTLAQDDVIVNKNYSNNDEPQVFIPKRVWNAEYKETNAKKDLAVDAVSRKELLKIFEDKFWELQRVKHIKENECAKDIQLGVNYCINILKELSSVTPQEPRWIPVSERLPEEGGGYLITNNIEIIAGKEPAREVRKNYFCINSQKWLYENDDVIAWMPLPKAYMPQESEEE